MTNTLSMAHLTSYVRDTFIEVTMKALLRGFAVPALTALSLCACSSDASVTTTAQIADGEYAVAFGNGYAAADEQDILAIKAEVNRDAGQVVFKLADGTAKTLTFKPRPEEQWLGDCATMDSVVMDEVADLSPAPVELLSMKFTAPIVYAKCHSGRMILEDESAAEGDPGLVFDLQPSGGEDGDDAATLCTDTGGAVEMSNCCTSTGDFPNSCLIGACGCAPDHSHMVQTCACPEGQCFDPAVGCK